MRTLASLVLFALLLGAAVGDDKPEAPAALDGAPNGLVDQATHDKDREAFDEVEVLEEGLGPIYNAQSCRECHQNPVSGGLSQVTELRVGHRDAAGRFANPSVPVANGAAVVTGRTLINDRAVCPGGPYLDVELQERVLDTETIRTQRTSLNLLGDGFVEALADETIKTLADRQCKETKGRICGLALPVPVLEVPGQKAIGKFGWKAQQASLLSFSADAYLNEMGITSRLLPDEFVKLCDPKGEPEDQPEEDGLADIDRFARFMRATKAPPRDTKLAQTEDAMKGSALFDSIGCATCHVRTLQTAPAGTKVNAGALTVPEALGDRVFHPFGDFLLHDVGTGDGIAVAVVEHFGLAVARQEGLSNLEPTANRMRTPPLWGVRMRSRLMHDGESETFTDAINRHKGEADKERKKFCKLKPREKEQLLAFLRSL